MSAMSSESASFTTKKHVTGIYTERVLHSTLASATNDNCYDRGDGGFYFVREIVPVETPRKNANVSAAEPQRKLSGWRGAAGGRRLRGNNSRIRALVINVFARGKSRAR